jgi:glycosyltransferase involved in cell wall biosynthesis
VADAYDRGTGGSPALAIRLESPRPSSLEAGSASAMYLSGTAMDGPRPVRALTLFLDGRPHRVSRIGMPRFDVPERRGGWWATVGVHLPADARELVIEAQAEGRDGTGERVELARIPVLARARASELARPGSAGDGPDTDTYTEGPIAVCMATYRPDPALLRAQIDSIRAQTDTNWSCVISDDRSEPEHYARILEIVGDDPRFSVSQAPEWLGFYRNFERALSLVAPEATLVVLSDQDDVWHPDKLATLRGAIGAAALVYSDQRLVDETGRVLRDTMWVGRANNQTNMASMLVANTVTGAATMIRRDVLERALPFPECPGIQFHDHWIALAALAAGRLAYVDRPLYDYVQHGGAVLGRVVGPGTADRVRSRLRLPRMHDWRGAYFLGYLPARMRAQTLLMRFPDTLSASQRRGLERYVRAEVSPMAFLWFVARPLRMLFGRTETRGGEWELAVGIVWLWLVGLVAGAPGWPDRYLLDTSFPAPLSFAQKRLGRWRERIS